MKIRTGYVSNSSSTSFSVFGVWLDDFSDEDWQPKFTDAQFQIIRDHGLTYICAEEGDVLLGRSWSKIGDNETGKEFKDSVREALRAMGIDEIPKHLEGEVYG